jgi:hypothetical protein
MKGNGLYVLGVLKLFDSYLAIRDAIDSDVPVREYKCECGVRVLYDTYGEEVIIYDSAEHLKPSRTNI